MEEKLYGKKFDIEEMKKQIIEFQILNQDKKPILKFSITLLNELHHFAHAFLDDAFFG